MKKYIFIDNPTNEVSIMTMVELKNRYKRLQLNYIMENIEHYLIAEDFEVVDSMLTHYKNIDSFNIDELKDYYLENYYVSIYDSVDDFRKKLYRYGQKLICKELGVEFPPKNIEIINKLMEED